MNGWLTEGEVERYFKADSLACLPAADVVDKGSGGSVEEEEYVDLELFSISTLLTSSARGSEGVAV